MIAAGRSTSDPDQTSSCRLQAQRRLLMVTTPTAAVATGQLAAAVDSRATAPAAAATAVVAVL